MTSLRASISPPPAPEHLLFSVVSGYFFRCRVTGAVADGMSANMKTDRRVGWSQYMATRKRMGQIIDRRFSGSATALLALLVCTWGAVSASAQTSKTASASPAQSDGGGDILSGLGSALKDGVQSVQNKAKDVKLGADAMNQAAQHGLINPADPGDVKFLNNLMGNDAPSSTGGGSTAATPTTNPPAPPASSQTSSSASAGPALSGTGGPSATPPSSADRQKINGGDMFNLFMSTPIGLNPYDPSDLNLMDRLLDDSTGKDDHPGTLPATTPPAMGSGPQNGIAQNPGGGQPAGTANSPGAPPTTLQDLTDSQNAIAAQIKQLQDLNNQDANTINSNPNSATDIGKDINYRNSVIQQLQQQSIALQNQINEASGQSNPGSASPPPNTTTGGNPPGNQQSANPGGGGGDLAGNEAPAGGDGTGMSGGSGGSAVNNLLNSVNAATMAAVGTGYQNQQGQMQVAQASGAGDDATLQGQNILNGAGAGAQELGAVTAAAAAQQQENNSWLNTIGTGLINGLGAGLNATVTTLGNTVASNVGPQICSAPANAIDPGGSTNAAMPASQTTSPPAGPPPPPPNNSNPTPLPTPPPSCGDGCGNPGCPDGM